MTTKKKKKRSIEFGIPQAVLASVAIMSLAAAYILAPDSRVEIEHAVLAAWAIVSTFLGPMIRLQTQTQGDES